MQTTFDCFGKNNIYLVCLLIKLRIQPSNDHVASNQLPLNWLTVKRPLFLLLGKNMLRPILRPLSDDSFYQADLEGIPEITLNITSSTLDFLVVHPCVLEGDTHVQIPSFQPSQMLKGPELVGRKVRFRPPTESFPLCHYSAKTPHGLPVQGIYQMQVKCASLHSIGFPSEETSERGYEWWLCMAHCLLYLPLKHPLLLCSFLAKNEPLSPAFLHT